MVKKETKYLNNLNFVLRGSPIWLFRSDFNKETCNEIHTFKCYAQCNKSNCVTTNSKTQENSTAQLCLNTIAITGSIAHLVKRPHREREVAGSLPGRVISKTI